MPNCKEYQQVYLTMAFGQSFVDVELVLLHSLWFASSLELWKDGKIGG